MTLTLFKKAEKIADVLKGHAKNIYMVGGCVRDHILGLPVKDIDIEVYGMDYNQIVTVLQANGFFLNLVGQQFAVIKVDNEIDISIPRRENKAGIGHTGFEVLVDPSMTFAEAASRRDFTINAMGMDFNGNIVDPYNGQTDLKNRMLRATSKAYMEDPLRVLRGVQFASRFNMLMDYNTILMSREMGKEFNTLSKERLWVEWEKWAKGSYPAMGLFLLKAVEWTKFFPEIHDLIEVQQDPEWHPEGDVFIHTAYVCDAAADIAKREGLDAFERNVLLFSALCHDFGKPSTTARNDKGRWSAKGHDKAGVPLAENFLKSINAPQVFAEYVAPLVSEHMIHIHVKMDAPSDKMLKRLAVRLGKANIQQLARVIEADHSGRPPLEKHNPIQNWLPLAESLSVLKGKQEKILMGKHLIAAGYTPGKNFGDILAKAYDAQLDGRFKDLAGALEWVKTNV